MTDEQFERLIIALSDIFEMLNSIEKNLSGRE